MNTAIYAHLQLEGNQDIKIIINPGQGMASFTEMHVDSSKNDVYYLIHDNQVCYL